MKNNNKSYVIEMYQTNESVNIVTQEGNMFFSYDIPNEYLQNESDVDNLMLYVRDKELNFKFLGEEEQTSDNIEYYTFNDVEDTLKYYLKNK
ncbi:hypothetical protein [Staphylococcus delphini]|uniref:Phage protein n=1 Tax=Staphylococcus delphini TaxID=53344 RepID=A0AAX0QTG8_9STAP|nr:hypothetical protein [Staphylococcus delphini]PCF50143.1 hypothetical protein B5C07_08015 [Staphylococcus delphini]PNZ95764.1 hypothetical protein CD148_03555 [Staphylococcus delphini]RIZ56225.1 hypothetical protein CDL68_01410 [Staphylococcus delphini]VED62451.1 Uncharacterised protein [Staphylococcus delphini]